MAADPGLMPALPNTRRSAILGVLALALGVQAQPRAPDRNALQRAHKAVVGLRSEAVDGARSARTLGQQRIGSGVVIGADGLVLTIGYLILETDMVELVTADDRRLPARVVAYDLATGLGLVQSLVPLDIEAAPLGRAASLAERDMLMFATGGDHGGVAPTRLLSRRPFSGYWEYHLDEALFTSPPWPMHSGAGLFNPQGELVGIGSLSVADAGTVDGARRPGNMFVPIDLLPPVLDEMRRSGSSSRSHRAWLGINCVEDDGSVRVVRVNDDSPADLGGVQVGDRILRIDGQDVSGLDKLWLTLWSGGPPEREVRLEVKRGDETHALKLFSVNRMKTLKRAQGI